MPRQCSEVRGYIHNVDYYFEADDKEHRESADLLMLTQGWRRYDWRLMSERYTFRKAQPIEDQFYLYGQLKEYRRRDPVPNVKLYVSLYNEKGQSLLGNAVTDSLGNYAFKMPFMDGEWKMFIYTTRETKGGEKRKTYYVGIDRQFSPVPRYLTPLETEILHPLKPNAFVRNPFAELEEEDEFIPPTMTGDTRMRRMERYTHHFTIMLTGNWITSLTEESLYQRLVILSLANWAQSWTSMGMRQETREKVETSHLSLTITKVEGILIG